MARAPEEASAWVASAHGNRRPLWWRCSKAPWRDDGVSAARAFTRCSWPLGWSTAIGIAARGHGTDDTTVSLVARAAAMLTWISGGMAALSLAVPPKDEAMNQAIVALAATRGVPEFGILRAEAMATVRLLAQVLVYPMIGIELFVLLFAGRGFGALADRMLGALVFSAIAALVLGALSSACRHWAKARGRSWLFSIVVIPWFAAELLNGQPELVLVDPRTSGASLGSR